MARAGHVALLASLMLLGGRRLGAQGVWIESDARAARILAEARRLECTFDYGVGFDYGQTTRPNTVPLLRPQPLSPGGYINPEVFDEIDRVQRTAIARYSRTAGPVTVTVLHDGLGLSFLQLVKDGDPVLTTVFAKLAPESGHELVAVITRHQHWFGGISVSQHYGRCKVTLGG